MRIAASIASAMLAIGSARLVVAQQPSTPGPIGRSMARAATHLATFEQSERVDAGWSRVRKIAPGTELIVTVKGSPPVNRYFVAGDESHLTVLNVSNRSLPATTKHALRDAASTHPEYFRNAQGRQTFIVANGVRLGSDGVFVADRKVADLAQVVEQYRRPDISEIASARTDSNPVGCALAGYYGGAVVGGMPGVVIGGAVGGDTGPALRGMLVGWSLGSVYVYRKCRHKPEEILYIAP